MATLAVAGAGAALGGIIGSQVAWLGVSAGVSVGLAAGQLAGNALFGPDPQTIEGPRLDDLSVQTASYGKAIPEGWGATRVAGNVIWASELIEKEVTRGGGGKGKGGMLGGGGPTTTTYEYYGNFAVHLCEGPIGEIRRVWADNKLVVDRSSNNTNGTPYKYGAQHYRFYLGTETQNPDPLIESYEGAENTPAYLGSAYIVFDGLPLQDFGNRIPSISVEVVRSYSTQDPVQYRDFVESEYLTSSQTSSRTVNTVLDPYKPFLYSFMDGIFYKINRISRDYEVMNLNDISANQSIDGLGAGTTFPIVDPFQGYFYTLGSSGLSDYVYEFDLDTYEYTGRSLNMGANDLSEMFGYMYYPDANFYPFILMGSITGYSALNVLQARGDTVDGGLEIVDQSLGKAGYYNSAFGTCKAMALDITGGRAWAMGQLWGYSDTDWIVQVNKDGTLPDATSIVDATGEAFQTSGGEQGRMRGLHYDAATDRLIFVVDDVGIYALDPDTFEILDRYDASVSGFDIDFTYGQSGQARNQPVIDGRLVTGGQDTVCFFDTTTMRPSDKLDINSVSMLYNDRIWDPLIQGLWQAQGGFSITFLNRLDPAPVNLGTVIQDLCIRGGMAAGDVDVSQVTDQIDGYTRTRQMSARAAIQPLMQAFQIDAVETGFQLKFVNRGGDPVATVADQHLGAHAGGGQPPARLSETRTQELELPSQVAVTYASAKRNYSAVTQIAQRIADTNASNSRLSVQLPIVMSDQDAKDLAETLLARVWSERQRYEMQLPPRYLELDPGDVVTVEKRAGELSANLTVRLEEIEMGGGGVLRCRGVAQSAATYSPQVPAHLYDEILETIAYRVQSVGFLFNGPALRGRADDTGAFWYAAAPAYYVPNPEWRGAVLYGGATDDAQSLAQITGVTQAITAFTVMTPPRSLSLSDPWATWDEDDAIDVRLLSDAELASYSALEVLDGANTIVIGREVLQFRDAELIAPRRYRLTGLLRGRYGTELFMSHTPGKTGFVVELDRMRRIGAEEYIGQERYFKTLTIGQSLLEERAQPFTNEGAALRPYAPAQLAGTRDGSDNLTITWQRRTRYGGQWQDGTEAIPLNEESEAYEVDILDGQNAVVRTISSLTAPSATYSAADQAADFGAAQSVIRVRVYQISAAVGRGYYREATL